MASSISCANKPIIDKYLILRIFIQGKQQNRRNLRHFPSRISNGQIPFAGEMTFQPRIVAGGRTSHGGQAADPDGVGQVQIFGSGDYAMRVWLNPEKLEARGLTAADVVAAITEQNAQVAASSIGQEPQRSGLRQFSISW
jgi:hypothetical protein